jgi:RNA 2',3'-cyclic 3'-phosphodiesterase
MRLFTAIDLPERMLMKLERLMTALRAEALVKWSPLDNLHITTKFIGSWPGPRLVELTGALDELGPRESFDVEIRDLGWYPPDRSPRVLWVGVHGGEQLIELARQTEQRLFKLGIGAENRPYSPHLTLARINNPVPLRGLRERVAELQPAALGSFAVSSFQLYRSDPGSTSSIYRRLHEVKFEAVKQEAAMAAPAS